jgi:hypothetical protein
MTAGTPNDPLPELEDRLFSHEQARRFALAYTALTLLGLALAVPHWRVLGLL